MTKPVPLLCTREGMLKFVEVLCRDKDSREKLIKAMLIKKAKKKKP
jgi:hypothetical protein